MTNRSKEFAPPAARNKSYLSKLPTGSKKHDKDARKSNVKDSLMKFLDDCGDEDLLIGAAQSPPKKSSNYSLSMSEHGTPRSRQTSDAPKRRGTKKDRPHINSLSSSSEHGAKRSSSLGMSEHGTPSTQKSPLHSLTRRADAKIDFDSSFSDAGLGGGGGALPLDHSERRKRRTASSHSSSKMSGSKDRVQRSKSHSSRMERTKSDRSDHVSRSDRSKPKGVRRTRSEDINTAGGLSLDRHLAGEERQQRRRSRVGGGGGDDDNRSVSSSRSSFSAMSAMTGTGKSLGLDAGPLNAFFAGGRRPSMNASSSASVGPGIPTGDRNDEAYLKLRKEKQDAIMGQVQKDRYKAKQAEKGDDDESSELHHHDGIPDGEDDDQPMVKSKTSVLKRFKKGVAKTGKVTKSTAKGTVNVVRDPKRAAKKVGGFAKDVTKETGKMLMDPKLAAKTAVSLGKDVTKGTYNIGKGVGKGVAKGGLGLTKTVAMTGVNATMMVAGTALDGAGKVVNGATGLIFKNGNGEIVDQYADYDAAERTDRRKGGMSLMDRVSNPMATRKKAAPDISTSSKPTRNSHSVLPGLLVGNNNSYDF